jgi:hypothetical protein
MSKLSARDKLYANGAAKFIAVYAATVVAIYVVERVYAANVKSSDKTN